MTVEIQVNNSTDARARFVGWAPAPCRIRVTDATGIMTPTVSVKLRSKSKAGAGAVVFRGKTTGKFTNTLTVKLPTNGTSVTCFVAGKFGRPSSGPGDVTIEARAGNKTVGSVPLMVRVRKDANQLTTAERDRFVAAFAQLNDRGLGRFMDFRNMHTFESRLQAHGTPAFLPWHRAYLLDLERELQAIDPSVALPYWRFDQPAPNLFTADFIGVSDPDGMVQFNPSNPLFFWRTDGGGIDRAADFDVATGVPPDARDEAATLALGSDYVDFRGPMEGNPHGSAHVAFFGSISSVPTAARDPLFFLLHCNVDRLWAKWQRNNGRFDPGVTASYQNNAAAPLGHKLPDTMWPWDGIVGSNQRPADAPGGALAASPCVNAPGPQPRVRDALDYQGKVAAGSDLGFAYDDVPFV